MQLAEAAGTGVGAHQPNQRMNTPRMASEALWPAMSLGCTRDWHIRKMAHCGIVCTCAARLCLAVQGTQCNSADGGAQRASAGAPPSQTTPPVPIVRSMMRK